MDEFRLEISPRMLELLSKDLYTSIYFVFAELIANSYDADAENVYLIIKEDEIVVEDDGKGMSSTGVQNDFLKIGKESRVSSRDSLTTKGRLKMGRKGVGKLSALAVSNGFDLLTMRDGKKVGVHIPSHIEKDDEVLKTIPEEKIIFDFSQTQGTRIVMRKPLISIPKTYDTIYNNLCKIFPINQEDFKIHLHYKNKEKVIKDPEKEVMKNLVTLITLGDEFHVLKKNSVKVIDSLFEARTMISKDISIIDKNGNSRNMKLEVKGWIGTMESTRNTKLSLDDFSDNYIAIFANGKMGARNIVQSVGRNRVFDNYITSNLHIDLFEHSDLPDMSSTNRQGYNESDIRWIESKKIIRELTDDIISFHKDFVKEKNKAKELEKIEKLKKKEEELKKQVDKFTDKVSREVSKKYKSDMTTDEVVDLVNNQVQISKKVIKLKNVISDQKKKILISQTAIDSDISDLVYEMLLFNGVSKEEVIYSNSGTFESDLPEKDIYGYLKSFFVDSYNKDDMSLLYITSKNVFNPKPKKNEGSGSWGCLMEMGAGWVVKDEYFVFNIHDFVPQAPINNNAKWVDIRYDNESKVISMYMPSVISFCRKIVEISNRISDKTKSLEENRKELLSRINLLGKSE